MMVDDSFRPTNLRGKLAWVVEECGELQAAIGKTQRFGINCANPFLEPEEQETNREWILREMRDLRKALTLLEDALTDYNAYPKRDD